MIELKKVCKTYNSASGQVVALKDIDLTVEDGDIYGIIGLSGAGKSTLVRCINGLEKTDGGEILYRGAPAKFDAEYRRNVAMIFQQFNLLQQRNVLKNVELAGEIAKDKNRKAKALKLLETVGLKDKANAYPSQLSGGQQQRVAIARALMTDPKVLLCDEATSALDPETTASVLELLKDLNKTMGLTIIIISHQMSVIEAVCNKVAIIDNAEIVTKGYLYDVFLSPQTDAAKKLVYAGRVSTAFDDKKLIKLKFDGQVDAPVVSNIIRDCNVEISILFAETKVIDGKSYGQIIFRLPSFEKDIKKLIKYLQLHGINYEEMMIDEL